MIGHLPEVTLFEAAMEGESSPSLDPEVAVHLTTCGRCQRRRWTRLLPVTRARVDSQDDHRSCSPFRSEG